VREHVLIAGGSGLVGEAALRLFRQRGDCDVTVLSRRPPPGAEGLRVVSADLTQPEPVRAALAGVTGVTRLVYAALHEEPELVRGWRAEAQIDTNDRMFRNLMAGLRPRSGDLRHVTLLQGTKAYGAHVRRMPIPAREGRDELRAEPNFYWRQEDHLRELADGAAWTWTILRPQVIFGGALGAAMNVIPAIGVYAALLREQGRPLDYPGGPGAIMEAVDADLLAEAIAWAGDTASAAGQVFNVTNGDVFTWPGVWPAIADALGMTPGEPRPVSLAETLPGRAAEWDAVRAKYGLAAPGLPAFVGAGLQYADFVMAYGFPAGRPLPINLVSTVRIRQAGFAAAMDTEAMFRKWFAIFQARGLLPPLRRLAGLPGERLL